MFDELTSSCLLPQQWTEPWLTIGGVGSSSNIDLFLYRGSTAITSTVVDNTNRNACTQVVFAVHPLVDRRLIRDSRCRDVHGHRRWHVLALRPTDVGQVRLMLNCAHARSFVSLSSQNLFRLADLARRPCLS